MEGCGVPGLRCETGDTQAPGALGAGEEKPYTDGVGAGFHIENFGCRAARADGEAIAARLSVHGCEALPLADADVVVVNTCSVTAEADREARAFIRRVRRGEPRGADRGDGLLCAARS